MEALGALFILLGFGIGVGMLVLWVWSLVDALRTPDARWRMAGQSKLLWVLLIVFLHVLGSVLYALIARPALRAQYL
ncbi:MAG: PLDc N-terminal domain-containing protein [Actinomycetes bacterium]